MFLEIGVGNESYLWLILFVIHTYSWYVEFTTIGSIGLVLLKILTAFSGLSSLSFWFLLFSSTSSCSRRLSFLALSRSLCSNSFCHKLSVSGSDIFELNAGGDNIDCGEEDIPILILVRNSGDKDKSSAFGKLRKRTFWTTVVLDSLAWYSIENRPPHWTRTTVGSSTLLTSSLISIILLTISPKSGRTLGSFFQHSKINAFSLG